MCVRGPRAAGQHACKQHEGSRCWGKAGLLQPTDLGPWLQSDQAFSPPCADLLRDETRQGPAEMQNNFLSCYSAFTEQVCCDCRCNRGSQRSGSWKCREKPAPVSRAELRTSQSRSPAVAWAGFKGVGVCIQTHRSAELEGAGYDCRQSNVVLINMQKCVVLQTAE